MYEVSLNGEKLGRVLGIVVDVLVNDAVPAPGQLQPVTSLPMKLHPIDDRVPFAVQDMDDLSTWKLQHTASASRQNLLYIEYKAAYGRIVNLRVRIRSEERRV